MSSFTVTAAHNKVKLDSSGAAHGTFTVTNTSAQTLKGRLLARAADPAPAAWFAVVGDSVRDFTPNTPAQIVVQLSVPQGSPPGSYSFRLDAVSQVDPDEDYTVGPSVAFEIKAPDKPKRPILPWALVVAGSIIVLVIVAFLAAK